MRNKKVERERKEEEKVQMKWQNIRKSLKGKVSRMPIKEKVSNFSSTEFPKDERTLIYHPFYHPSNSFHFTICHFWCREGGMCSDGQTPWPNGRPADTDSISDQWSKFRKITIFRKKFRKDLNQNIDQFPTFVRNRQMIEIFREKK